MVNQNNDRHDFFWSLLFFLALLQFFVVSSVAQESTQKTDSPRIIIDPESYDFGTVDRGVWLKHQFAITNTGNAPLVLSRTYATCGCTLPKLNKSKLLPGETGALDVSVDTSMKQNRITKSVFVVSDDPLRPSVKVDLSMNVVDPHSGMTEANKAKIFTAAQCSSCHVARGVGKFGRDLYNADCAMCHGPKAEGAIGPTLIGPYEDSGFARQMTQVASFGSSRHCSMPGFLAEAGGPLNKQELDSVLKYLADLSNKRRTGH
jgi:mono/diheme cytochrome c family protein